MARNTNTIRSKGDYAQEEGYTTTAITPGMLVQIDTAELLGLNDEPQIKACVGVDVNVERAFAVEDGLQGKTVDDDYAIDELVTYIVPQRGSCINARVGIGTYAVGDELIGDGAGALIASVDATYIAVAMEALVVADGNADNLVRVRVL